MVESLERHKNLAKWEGCLLQYDGKIKATYRLPLVSEGGLFRTVVVGCRPKRHCKASLYKSVPLEELTVGVPHLALIVPEEKLPKD